jgi:hypothetical protein
VDYCDPESPYAPGKNYEQFFKIFMKSAERMQIFPYNVKLLKCLNIIFATSKEKQKT